MTVRMTEEEFRKIAGQKFEGWKPGTSAGERKPSKYRNVRTELDGQKFDSRHEAQVWAELQARVKAGELRIVLRQVSIPLAGGAYRYRADFMTIDKEMRVEIIDAKSDFTRKNRVYINKKKQILHDYGIEIKEM